MFLRVVARIVYLFNLLMSGIYAKKLCTYNIHIVEVFYFAVQQCIVLFNCQIITI